MKASFRPWICLPALGAAALRLACSMLPAVDRHLAAARLGPCTALLAVASTEPATTPCTWGKRAKKKASSRPWVRMQALDAAALRLARPLLPAVDLRLAAARLGPCTALLAVSSSEPATTPCTWGKRARKKASSRPWVRIQALDTAVLVTKEDLSQDRLTGPLTTCLPMGATGIAVVPLVAANMDTDTATHPMDTDTDATAEVCTTRAREREASVSYTAGELVGLVSRVLVRTEEGWAGLSALPRDRRTDRPTECSTKVLRAHRPA